MKTWGLIASCDWIPFERLLKPCSRLSRIRIYLLATLVCLKWLREATVVSCFWLSLTEPPPDPLSSASLQIKAVLMAPPLTSSFFPTILFFGGDGFPRRVLNMLRPPQRTQHDWIWLGFISQFVVPEGPDNLNI